MRRPPVPPFRLLPNGRATRSAPGQLDLFVGPVAAAPIAPAPAARASILPSRRREGFTFYLGTHRPYWLFWEQLVGIPMFLSYRQLRTMQDARQLQRARTYWCMDSGGFQELSREGRWTYTARRYAEAVRRFHGECGGLEWAAIMDWMTEECVLAKTGESVEKHQERTIDSLFELRSIAPEIPWTPVLQGWARGDHLRHVEAYARRGVDLWREPVVGVGSVCRRSDTLSGSILLSDLASTGIKLHAFGFKIDGLTSVSQRGLTATWDARHGLRFELDPAQRAVVPLWMRLRSADSTAWSMNANNTDPLPGHTHKHCNNCVDYAVLWYHKLLGKLREAAAELGVPAREINALLEVA